MFVLDTDTLTLLLRGHPKVIERRRHVEDAVVITIFTQIEVLRGRFDSLLKAADGEQLLLAQQRLQETERDLEAFHPLLVNEAAVAEFVRLLEVKGLKKIGRADLLIAAVTLANKATLVTRNLKHLAKVPGLQVENWAD